jgi:NTP pyrophosphatase (non-canonical NTP hydrolase)
MEKLITITKGLNRRFPEGVDPFKIITRLAEECGELAKEVNHWERTGYKIQKYGEPDKKHLAKEVADVMRCALQVALYYGVEEELKNTFNESYERLKNEGFIE